MGSSATPVYWSGLGGYRFFRIPVLHRAGPHLLAFAEGRSSRSDTGSIDIVLRRSADSGQTWGGVERVLGGAELGRRRGGTTVGNPVPLYLPRSRVLLLLFCSNSGRFDERAIRRGKVPAAASRRVWLARSATLGANWSAPTELTAQVKRPEWTWYAVGPGGALRLRNGTLLVPATHAAAPSKMAPGQFDHSHVLVSHDSGATWGVGAPALAGTNEATIAELDGGSVLLNARYLRKPGGRRRLQLSLDGGASWGDPWEGPREPRNPSWSPSGCHGSMAASRRGALFYSGPDTDGRLRANVTLSRSDDGGRTWPRRLLLHAGPSGYSSVSRLPGGGPILGVLLEAGNRGEHYAKRIDFQRARLDR